MIGDFACRVLLHVFGYLWPAYCTYKALEAKQGGPAVERWCRYWLILALFTTAERMVLDWTVFWVPLYYEGKLLFVLWLWHGSSNGAAILYSRALRPLLRQHEATIDASAGEAQALVFDYVSQAISWTVAFIRNNAYLLTGYLQNLRSFQEAQPQQHHKHHQQQPQHRHQQQQQPQGQNPLQTAFQQVGAAFSPPQDHAPEAANHRSSRAHSRGPSEPESIYSAEDVPTWMGGKKGASRNPSAGGEADTWGGNHHAGQGSPSRHGSRSPSPEPRQRKWN